MWKGVLVSAHISPAARAAMNSVSEVRAVPGKGLEHDRYFNSQGTFSKPAELSNEVTLIEMETIEALKRESGIELAPGESRRNLVTRGVPLNHLVGKEFRVGEVKLRGLRLCEPCGHLESLTQGGVKAALAHRGGLRAQIVKGGIIRVGDVIEELRTREQAKE